MLRGMSTVDSKGTGVMMELASDDDQLTELPPVGDWIRKKVRMGGG